MFENCIDNFLIKCDPSHVERHSDSSDFENSCSSPVVTPKYGYYSLTRNKQQNTKQEKEAINQQLYEERYNINTQSEKSPALKKRKRARHKEKSVNTKVKYSKTDNVVRCYNRNRGDQIFPNQLERTRRKARKAISPSSSTSEQPKKFNKGKEENLTGKETVILKNNLNCKAPYANCERSRIKTLNKQGRYLVQPVYAFEERRKFTPLQKTYNPESFTLIKNFSKKNSEEIYNYDLSSSSEVIVKPNNNKKIKLKQIISRLDKYVRKEYAYTGTIKHQVQQCPSKPQFRSPFEVITSSACQTKCSLSDREMKIPSHSSSFFDFLYKIFKSQVLKNESTKDACYNVPEPCTPEKCEFLKAGREINKSRFDNIEGFSHCSEQCAGRCPQAELESNKSKETNNSQETEVICKCHSGKKEKSRNKQSTSRQEESKCCQEKHDVVTKAVSEKYNGEILCIHNPPCVLINGCLNLPQPKSTEMGQGNFWPVTQTKKSSFAQICQKIKRKKPKNTEQAIQYQPPSIDLQEYLPEFRTEKIVQSMCNHSPPCSVVHGCCKMKYNPTLQTSCIHVPMCPKLPECLMDKRNIDAGNRSCDHNPRCMELPLCTRRYTVFNAKENVSTQVKSKGKQTCRHYPTCFMIPKCLAHSFKGIHVPGCAIPGCVHDPTCDMVPACLRTPTVEMTSIPSQYPNPSCRIV